jgi:hypothetical protein
MSELRPPPQAGVEDTPGVKIDGKAPWPTSLIEYEFFVFVWNRDFGRFELYLDDEEHTSYDLGSNVQLIMDWLKRVGLYKLGCEGIDRAREFGAAQVIPSQDRILALKNPTPKTKMLFKNDIDKERPNAGYRTL